MPVTFIQQLPHAFGKPEASAKFRATPQDFRVTEEAEVPVHEGGAHWWLRITKTGWNTKDVARALCEVSSARIRQVGYAGLKDRHAVTTQWFSLPIEAVDPEQLTEHLPDGLQLTSWQRARHAVRRGGLRANHFEIRLRDFEGDRLATERRIERSQGGVPNYFGEQRFGSRGQNLAHVRKLFRGEQSIGDRHVRGLYLSAARSWLFNRVLAQRVLDGSWETAMDGEALILDGSRSWFPASSATDEEITERLERFDIHPSGPLHGLGESASTGVCLTLERDILSEERELAEGLEAFRMKKERRALRLVPSNLGFEWQNQDLIVTLSLPSGAYATTVLREIIECNTLDK